LVSNADSLVVFGPGEFELRLIDTVSNCVSPVERVRVELNTNEPNAVIFADPDSIFDCTVRTITLSTEIEENVVYSWQGGEVNATGASVNVFNSGVITLLAVDTISLCSDTATINLEDFDDFPRISIAPPDELSCADSVVLLDASESYFSDEIVYEWFDEQSGLIVSDTDQISVTAPGWYYFRSTDVGNDCVNEDSVLVTANFDVLDISILGDTNLPCGVDEGALILEVDGNLSPFSIQWSTADGQILSDANAESVNFMGEGNYMVEVIHPESFCPSTESVNVSASGDLSVGNILVDSIICFGDEGRIQVEDVEGTPPIELRLNNELIEVGEWIPNLPAGQYVIEAEDANGCRAETIVNLAEGVPIEISLEPVSANVDQGESVRVEVQTNIEADQIASVLWAPPTNLSCSDCLSTTVTAISDEEYEVTITDIRGCFASAIFRLLVRPPKIHIFIPNIFTPNGDGVNDGFTLFTDSELNIDRLMIFDRWGNKVFENRNLPPNDPDLGWNGRFKGELVNPGVYVYSFQITFPDGTEEIIHGDITVNR
jgi:gliding motility-associated-like protein